MGRLARARTAVAEQARRTALDIKVATSNRALRRVQLAWGLSHGIEWGYYIALEVFAFEVDGALGVGIVGVMSELPSALAAPLTSVLGDRMRRERLLLVLALVRSLELSLAALAYSQGAPSEFFYALLGFDSILSSAVFPAQQGLIPKLARSRAEYASSAPVTALVETIGGGLGPVVGGVLLATTNLGFVYAFAAAMMLSTGIIFIRLPRPEPAATGASASESVEGPLPQTAEDDEPGNLFADFVDGLRAVRGNRSALLLLALFAIDAFLEGALDVFVIVIALDVLQIGAAGVGALGGVEAVGGLIGAIFALNLVTRERLALRWGLLSMIDAIPSILLGAFPLLGVAVVSLIFWEGIGTLDEAMGLTLLRRVVPRDLLSRALGLEDSAVTLSIALGSIAAPGMIALFGNVRTALVVTGIGAVAFILLALPGLRRIDTRGVHSRSATRDEFEAL